MKSTLIAIGGLGTLLFCMLFAITFSSPQTIESTAKGFIKTQIEKEVKDKYERGVQSSLGQKALGLAEKLGLEKNKIQQDLKNELPKKIANIIASMCGYDCEKKKAIAKGITKGYLDRITKINIAESNLGDIVKGKYIEIMGNLKTDLRIFLGSNSILFLTILSLVFFKPQAMVQLFIPAVLLAITTIISSGIYVYGQDWFYTILYNDYMGFGYLIYVIVIFSFLLDIVLNRARVTTEILNGLAHALGSSFSASPC